MYRFGWFSSGRDKAARDLIKAAHNSIQRGEIKAEIAFVFCSRESGESAESNQFIELVNHYQIPLVCYSYQRFKADNVDSQPGGKLPQWRLEYDRRVMDRLKNFKPDLCILAGYMLIVGEEMCSRYDMINLHPAAPGGPAGTWQEVIWKLMDKGAGETGVMMHLVTPELDRGPVVSYCTFSIRGAPFDRYWQQIKGQEIERIKRQQGENNPLFCLIRRHGMKRELPLMLATMKAFSRGDVKIIGGRVVDSEGRAITGYNLTGEVDKLVKDREAG